MKLKMVALVLLIAVVVSGSLYSSGAAETEAVPSGPVIIDFWYSIGGNPQKATKALIEKFNSSQNEVIVEGMYGGSYEDTTKNF